MLKPEQIKNEQFELSVLGGYKREQVDEFFAVVSSDYEKLFAENNELIQKLKLCVEKIEDYQKDEQFLKTAIINAEKLNETSLRDIEKREKEIETAAREKADLIVKNATLEAENIIAKAKQEFDSQIKECELETAQKIAELKELREFEEAQLNNLKKEVSDFKEKILKLYENHLNSITKLPEFKQKPKEEKVVDQPVLEDPAVEVLTPPTPVEEPGEKQPETIEKPATDIVSDDTKIIATQTQISFDIEEEPKETKKDDATAEFVIEKAKKPEVDEQAAFERNFKFKDLKFGTDFNLKDE